MNEEMHLTPEQMLEMMQKNKERMEERAQLTLEYLSSLDSEEMIDQLKHLLYRTLPIITNISESYEELDVVEKLLLDTTENLMNGVLNAIKWIALDNEVSYQEPFGDSLLVQEVGDIMFGKPISLEDFEEEEDILGLDE